MPDRPEVSVSPSASPVTGSGPASLSPRYGGSLHDLATGTTVGQRHPPVGQASGYTPGVHPDAVRNAALQPGQQLAHRTLEFLGAAKAAAPAAAPAADARAQQLHPSTATLTGDDAAAHAAALREPGFANHRPR